MPGTDLHTWNTAVSKTDKCAPLMGLHSTKGQGRGTGYPHTINTMTCKLYNMLEVDKCVQKGKRREG